MDWITKGLIKLLCIVAMLQLIKKLPDIINTIFGTNIKPQGGIKGRLGEMAGIGGLAQKAWGTLGNAGKLLAASPLAAGYLLANQRYKRNHKGKSLRETGAFRQGVGILSGLRSGLKTGSLLTAYQDYDKGTAPPNYTHTELRNVARRTRDGLRSAGISNQGVYDNYDRDAEGRIQYVDGKPKFKDRTMLDRDKNLILADAKTQLPSISGSLESGFAAQVRASEVKTVQSARQDISDLISNLKTSMDGNNYSKAEISQIEGIQKAFDRDGVLSSTDASILKSYLSLEGAKDLAVGVKKYDKVTRIAAANSNGEYTEADLRGKASLGAIVGTAEAEVKGYLEDQKDAVSKMSEAEKTQYQVYAQALEGVASKYGVTAKNDGAIEDTMARLTGTEREDRALTEDHEWAVSHIGEGDDLRDWWEDAGSNVREPVPADDDDVVPPAGPTGEPTGETTTSVIVDTTGRPIQMPTESGDNSYISAPTADEIDDRDEAAWTARINELNAKSNLTAEEREELEDLTHSVQRIAASRLERNGGASDE